MTTRQSNGTNNRFKEKGTYLTKENWEVMKPFVHVAFKAIALIGSALIAIVKLLPKALENKQAPSQPFPEGRSLKILKNK